MQIRTCGIAHAQKSLPEKGLAKESGQGAARHEGLKMDITTFIENKGCHRSHIGKKKEWVYGACVTHQQCVAWFCDGNRLSAGEVLIMLVRFDMMNISKRREGNRKHRAGREGIMESYIKHAQNTLSWGHFKRCQWSLQQRSSAACCLHCVRGKIKILFFAKGHFQEVRLFRIFLKFSWDFEISSCSFKDFVSFRFICHHASTSCIH